MTIISTDISFPVGVRSLLFEEARRRRQLEAACVAALEEKGFGEIVLPVVDFVDPYEGIIDARRTYRFTDREGELVAVRSDFTPLVARTLAPVLEAGCVPLRVFYRGDVVRCEPTRLGRDREFFQIGAEIVGDASVEAEREIMDLAATLVRLCGATPAVATGGSAVIPNEGGRMGGSEESGRGLLPRAMNVPPPGSLAPTRPSAALGMTGGQSCARSSNSPGMTAVQPSYYTGLQFSIYAAESRVEVARGGRYDALYGRFGADQPAVGFTLSLDPLEVMR